MTEEEEARRSTHMCSMKHGAVNHEEALGMTQRGLKVDHLDPYNHISFLHCSLGVS